MLKYWPSHRPLTVYCCNEYFILIFWFESSFITRMRPLRIGGLTLFLESSLQPLSYSNHSTWLFTPACFCLPVFIAIERTRKGPGGSGTDAGEGNQSGGMESTFVMSYRNWNFEINVVLISLDFSTSEVIRICAILHCHLES